MLIIKSLILAVSFLTKVVVLAAPIPLDARALSLNGDAIFSRADSGDTNAGPSRGHRFTMQDILTLDVQRSAHRLDPTSSAGYFLNSVNTSPSEPPPEAPAIINNPVSHVPDDTTVAEVHGASGASSSSQVASSSSLAVAKPLRARCEPCLRSGNTRCNGAKPTCGSRTCTKDPDACTYLPKTRSGPKPGARGASRRSQVASGSSLAVANPLRTHCEPCREFKNTRCDGAKPCGSNRCKDAPDACIYLPQERSGRKPGTSVGSTRERCEPCRERGIVCNGGQPKCKQCKRVKDGRLCEYPSTTARPETEGQVQNPGDKSNT